MPIEHGQVMDMLLQACPDFSHSWDELHVQQAGQERLLFADLQLFAVHVVECLRDGRIQCFPAVFGVVERLLSEGDDLLRERVLVALLLDLQTQLAVAQLDADAFWPWLGTWGRTFWARLDTLFTPIDAGDVARLYEHHRGKLAHPLNDAVVRYLEKQARPDRSEPRTFGWVEGFELHTHPDLDERLHTVAGGLPDSVFDWLFGCRILVSGGIIFAIIRGTRFLAFRLSDDDSTLSLELGAVQVVELGRDWVSVDPWQSQMPIRKGIGDLRYWCDQAYRYALALGGSTVSANIQ